MSGLDLTGRTNGAGTHITIAGREYVWVVNDDDVLELQPFARAEFLDQIRELAAAAGGDTSDPVAAELLGGDV